MIPNETLQTLQTTGKVNVVNNFGVTNLTLPRILFTISDSMYTRKELAVIREYANNGADAQIVMGKPVSDLIVTLPTLENLSYKVRDFGPGLTHDEIRNIYCILGESTKRNSPNQNGVLGYGCKAGFSRADSFTVTSWVNGEKTIYNCIKGDIATLPRVIELSRFPSDEPTGIEINVPVAQSGLWTYHREAADFFKYWEVLPKLINLDETHKTRMDAFRNTAPTLSGDGWAIRPKATGTAEGIAFMGGVSYEIKWSVLYNHMALDSKKRVLFNLLQQNDVVLYFKMQGEDGLPEINFVDNRESLAYTDLTLKSLSNRLETIFSKIQESIQNKFNEAKNIWEAKMIYNGLFGTGLIEVEKGESADAIEKIKILDGNLVAIENTFRNAFTWNSIPLTSSDFGDINRFDNAFPDKIHDNSWTPSYPVMVTYRKKKLRAKVNKCNAESNNKIVASHQVAVVINDIGIKTGHSVISRYLIFGAPDTKYRTIHILTFADFSIQTAFYKEFGFETVPVIKMSEIVPLAKAWHNANKTSRTYKSNGGGGGIRIMRYMDIETQDVEESEIPVREIEGENYFIDVGDSGYGSGKKVKMPKYSSEDPDEVVGYIKTISDKLDLDINRVYIINKQTSNAKWFKAAVESGDWINIWDFIKENLEAIDFVPLVTASAYEQHESNLVCAKTAEQIKPLIKDKNSQFLKLIECCGSEDYTSNVKLSKAIKHIDMWREFANNKQSSIDFAKLAKECEHQYPFLSKEKDALCNSSYLNKPTLDRIVKYINAMDLYIDLCPDSSEVEAPEKTENTDLIVAEE